MEDSNAAYSAYQAGEVSLCKDVPTAEIPRLRDQEDFYLVPKLATASFQTEKKKKAV